VKNIDLINVYRHLFAPSATIQCGPGWSVILQDMCFSLDYLLTEFQDEHSHDFQINQIISKFGILYIEYENGDQNIKKIIDFAQKISYYTCEVCGTPGKIYCSTKWLLWSDYKTLCKDHAIEYYYYEIRHPKGK
tara:strand:+ start:2576 stop:2977 length:402 start_codon:yes stop_codon:yes gene_type:complete